MAENVCHFAFPRPASLETTHLARDESAAPWLRCGLPYGGVRARGGPNLGHKRAVLCSSAHAVSTGRVWRIEAVPDARQSHGAQDKLISSPVLTQGACCPQENCYSAVWERSFRVSVNEMSGKALRTAN